MNCVLSGQHGHQYMYMYFWLRRLDFAARHELDPENLQTTCKSLKVSLFQIITKWIHFSLLDM